MNTEEFLKKYAGVNVSFVSYYKYKFTYAAIIDDMEITVELGDSCGDVYCSVFECIETIRPCNLLSFWVKEIGQQA